MQVASSKIMSKFLQSHNRHHNVKVITALSTGIAEMLMELNITTVVIIILPTRNGLPATYDLFNLSCVFDCCCSSTDEILTDCT